MGSNLSGFRNENDLISALNEKKIYELNENLKNLIKFLYGTVDENSTIYANNGKKGQKPDVIININNKIKKMSVKIGAGNSVHQENIDIFIDFLRSENISNKIIEELLKFHWGDGTLDGTGTIRVSGTSYKNNHVDEINSINEEINRQPILKKAINRFLFQGKSNDYEKIDVIYYGDAICGHWATTEEIESYILTRKFENSSVHFGPLNYQVWNRCLNFNNRMENRRQVIQIKWSTLLKDILFIERNRE